MSFCPNCDFVEMDSLGYGDEQCPECGHTERSESEEDFNKRMKQLSDEKSMRFAAARFATTTGISGLEAWFRKEGISEPLKKIALAAYKNERENLRLGESQLYEGAEMGDLARLVNPVMTIDEFRSKMGDDKDIVVVGFTVFGKEPADDLVNFVEKSYDWVLDADISSGETSDGNYLVFVEIQRKSNASEHIFTMLTDMMNLTEQDVKDWSFTYYKGTEQLPATEENLKAKIIPTPEDYELKTSANLEEAYELNKLRASAGVTVQPSIVTDLQILDIQIAAGIK